MERAHPLRQAARHCLGISLVLLLCSGLGCKSTGPYGLQPPDLATCKPCHAKSIPRIRTFYPTVSRDSVFLVTDAYQWFKGLANEDAKWKVAIELVPKSPSYACTEPAELFAANGQLTQPISLKKLLKAWDANQPVQRIFMGMKELPEGRYEANVYFIHQRQLCRVNHFQGFCQEIDGLSFTFKLPRTPLDLLGGSPARAQSFPTLADTAVFLFPFAGGSAEVDPQVLQQCHERLGQDSAYLKAIDIRVFTSIEGGQDENDCLLGQRAQRLRRAIRPGLPQQREVPMRIYADMNWDLFYRQLPRLEGQLPGREEEEWRAFLKENPAYLEELEPLFAQQRVARVELLIEKPLPAYNGYRIALERFRGALDSVDTGLGIDAGKLQQAQKWQGHLYAYLQGSVARAHVADSLEIPLNPLFGELEMTRWAMQAHWPDSNRYRPERIADWEQRFAWVDTLYHAAPRDPLRHYNYLAHLLNYPGKQMPLDWDEFYQEADALASKAGKSLQPKIELLLREMNIRMASEGISGWVAKRYRIKALERLWESYQDSIELSRDERLELAKFFLQGGTFSEAQKVLEPLCQGRSGSYLATDDPEVLELLVQIAYLHPELFIGSSAAPEQKTQALDYLVESASQLSPDTWCQLFSLSCGIGFQPLDYAPVRERYCELCQEERDVLEIGASSQAVRR